MGGVGGKLARAKVRHAAVTRDCGKNILCLVRIRMLALNVRI